MKTKKTEENQAVLDVFPNDFFLEWCAFCRKDHISCSGKKEYFLLLHQYSVPLQLFLFPCGECNKLQLNAGTWKQECPCSV